MRSRLSILFSLGVGAIAGAVGVVVFDDATIEGLSGESASTEPLYWVAPMDPDYRRPEPGKSPMGMDLVPVYESDNGGAATENGVVEISPRVVNNLGVRTGTVERGRLQLAVSTVGYVQYDEDHVVHISPRVEGWLETLHITANGDPVVQGEPLYTLYSPTLVNAQEEFLLALKRNNPRLIQAALDRMAALEVPQSSIEKLRKTGTVSQTVTVAAPQSGVVDNLDVRDGMYVMPGSMLMSVGQLKHIWVIGEVFARHAGLIGLGDKITMQLDYLPGKQFEGQVDYIYPTLSKKTRTVQIRAKILNPDGMLKPGMFVEMTVDTQSSPPSLLIPREALIRTGSQMRVVRASGEGQFKSVAVSVGRIGKQQVEILSGLEEGERIVISAQFLIDSESSKTAEFERMSVQSDGQQSGAMSGTADRTDMTHQAAPIDEQLNQDKQTMPQAGMTHGTHGGSNSSEEPEDD